LDPKAALELPFELTVERRAGAVVMILQGELDLAAKDRYEEELAKLADESFESLVVDLRGLTFIDSTGIKLLLGTLRDSEQNGLDVSFVKPDGPVKSLLDTTGVADQLPLVDERPAGPSS
jgi:anti-sigma B factor antagonist